MAATPVAATALDLPFAFLMAAFAFLMAAFSFLMAPTVATPAAVTAEELAAVLKLAAAAAAAAAAKPPPAVTSGYYVFLGNIAICQCPSCTHLATHTMTVTVAGRTPPHNESKVRACKDCLVSEFESQDPAIGTITSVKLYLPDE